MTLPLRRVKNQSDYSERENQHKEVSDRVSNRWRRAEAHNSHQQRTQHEPYGYHRQYPQPKRRESLASGPSGRGDIAQ